jgi:hypothetical protein
MITYAARRLGFTDRRHQPKVLSAFGWYFVMALVAASGMGAALAMVT